MIGSKMTDSSTLNPKVNSLMNLFLKREATQPLPVHKPAKKVKPNEEYLCPHQAKPATPSTIYYPGEMMSNVLLSRLPPLPESIQSPILPKPTRRGGASMCRASS